MVAKSASLLLAGEGERGNGALNEDALLRRYATTRDPVLKQELVRRLLPLARSLALRYRGSPEPLDDLIQVASLGLVKALDGFDPDRGRRSPPTRRRRSWASFAATSATGSGSAAAQGLQERTIAVHKAAAALSEELGRTPTVSQIAERLELADEEVLEALQADEARRTLSLEGPEAERTRMRRRSSRRSARPSGL